MNTLHAAARQLAPKSGLLQAARTPPAPACDLHPAPRAKAALLLVAAWGMLALPCPAAAQDQSAVALPPGVKAVWDAAKARRETTPTRERLCINGLWRWQPAAENALDVPAAAWGYCKVPACWPGSEDYLQSDYQRLYPHPSWKDMSLREVRSAWYERTITIPHDWTGRRILLDVEYLNSYAAIYVDGRAVGQLRFPAGQVDLSAAVRPGAKHVLSLLVVAMPLKALMESYNDTNTAKQRKGRVERRGLCGNLWLVSEPPGARLELGPAPDLVPPGPGHLRGGPGGALGR